MDKSINTFFHIIRLLQEHPYVHSLHFLHKRDEDNDNSNNWELSVDKEDKMTQTTPKQIEVDSGCFSIRLC